MRFVTYLAPCLASTYESIVRHVGTMLGMPVEFSVGSCYDTLKAEADLAFVCGLPYVELTQARSSTLVPLAAPVVEGARYGGMPIYFSDVIVLRDSGIHTFADLRHRTWSYNEPHSQSGYGITRYHLVQMGETAGFFGKVVEAGWHERSIRLVLSGEVDASAIDSHVLAVVLRQHPEWAEQLRIIESFGPSPIQPIVANHCLPASLRQELQAVLTEMADSEPGKECLAQGMIDRLVPVNDGDYDSIRAMESAAREVCYSAIH